MNEENKVDGRSQVYADKECPHCKKMVTGVPGPFARHVQKCMTTPSVDTIKNDDIRRTIEKALAIQQSMLDAPELATVDLDVDVNMSLRKRYAPETMENYDENSNSNHTHTAYFGDARAMSVDIAKGFIPKLNENGEYVVNDGGDILYTRPRKITEAIIKKSQMESRMRLSTVTEAAQKFSSAKGIEAPGNAEGIVKEEEYGEVGTLTLKPGEV